MSSFKPKKSLRLALLSSGGIAAMTMAATPAAAATLASPLVVVVVDDNDGSCGIGLTAGVTGTTADGAPGSPDKVRVYMVHGTAMTPVPNEGGTIRSAAVGTTQTLNLTSTAPAQTAPLSQIRVILRDVDAANVPISQLDIIDVPDALFANSSSPACRTFVGPINQPPTANAGSDQTAAGGSAVSLQGTASDPETDPLTYQWVQTGGPSVTLSGANTLTPGFTAPARQAANQVLTFSLTASDGTSSSTPDTVQVTIPANVAPVANAGADATAIGGSRVTLEGTVTDGDNDPVSFVWTQIAGPSVALAGSTTANPSFDAPARTAGAQVLTFQLVGFDGFVNSAADTVDITVPGNLSPIANAGPDQSVRGASTVTLTAAGSSDPEGDTLTYQWVQVAGPPVTLAGSNTRNPTFVAPAGASGNQTLSFRVTVTDPLTTGDAPTDVVDIVVQPNAAPVANAGPDQGPINTGSTVTLNGGASTDPDGNPLTYSWTQVSGPSVTLTNPTSATPSFVAPNVSGTQNIVFQLVVNDGTVNSAPDTVAIAIRAVGTITIIQRVVGADGTFSYTSSVSGLAGSITTVNGSGTRVASLVPAGSHSVTGGDARAAGYALTAIACNDTDSVVSLANRNVAIALSPNENLVCTFTSTNTREAALTAISNFLTARNAALLANRPDLQRRLDRLNGVAPSGGSASISGLPIPGSGHLPASLRIADGRAYASTSLGMMRAAGKGERGSKPFDIWTEAYFASLDYNQHKGSFRLIYTGADYRISPGLLVGVLAQFDDFDIKGARIAGSADGNGWMAGPYVTAKLAPSLYFDARAAWGKSNNTVSPLGTYVDAFKTNRSLYSGALIGQFNLGSAAQFRPEVTVRYLEERQQNYVDSFLVTIPGQTVGQGDISFRPRFHYTADMGGGWAIRPYAEAEGIYTFGLERQTVLTDDFRMRIEGGADLFSAQGIRFGLSGFHDGIGSGGLKSTGAHVSVSFGF